MLDDKARARLDAALAESNTLKVVYEYSQRLQSIWQQKTASQETLIQSLQEWCHHAEQTGIEALQDFARTLKAYRLQEA
jgi:stearoyl-CoA desaturase (delta-9 desaturase)